MPGGYASTGLCLLRRAEINELPATWHIENECPEFYEWIPGFTSAEHWRMRHTERMLAREDQRDEEMRAGEDRRDARAQTMRKRELVAVVGTIIAILIAAVIGAAIQRGGDQKIEQYFGDLPVTVITEDR